MIRRIPIRITERTYGMTKRDRWAALIGDTDELVGAEALLWAVLHDTDNHCLALRRSAELLCAAWSPGVAVSEIKQVVQPAGCSTCGGLATLKPLYVFLQQGGLWLEAEASAGRLSDWLLSVFGCKISAAVILRGAIKRIG